MADKNTQFLDKNSLEVLLELFQKEKLNSYLHIIRNMEINFETDDNIYPRGTILVVDLKSPSTKKAQDFKVADGIHKYSELEFLDTSISLSPILRGRYKEIEDEFYTNIEDPESILPRYTNKLYIDNGDRCLYYIDETNHYVKVTGSGGQADIPWANNNTAGKAYLFDTLDPTVPSEALSKGAVSQPALKDKFEDVDMNISNLETTINQLNDVVENLNTQIENLPDGLNEASFKPTAQAFTLNLEDELLIFDSKEVLQPNN